MIVLIDTDILLDVTLNRYPHVLPAVKLFEALQNGSARGCLAWHSLSNFYYLAHPVSGPSAAKNFLQELLMFVEVCSTGTKEAKEALNLPFKDFEDALQCAAALSMKADVIATRNLQDFRHSPIPAKSPIQILKKLGVQI